MDHPDVLEDEVKLSLEKPLKIVDMTNNKWAAINTGFRGRVFAILPKNNTYPISINDVIFIKSPI